jgi:hypothetical protein
MPQSDRIERIVKEEWPGCSVKFEPGSYMYTKFTILKSNGEYLSKIRPFIPNVVLGGYTDDELKGYLRCLLGVTESEN